MALIKVRLRGKMLKANMTHAHARLFCLVVSHLCAAQMNLYILQLYASLCSVSCCDSAVRSAQVQAREALGKTKCCVSEDLLLSTQTLLRRLQPAFVRVQTFDVAVSSTHLFFCGCFCLTQFGNISGDFLFGRKELLELIWCHCQQAANRYYSFLISTDESNQ